MIQTTGGIQSKDLNRKVTEFKGTLVLFTLIGTEHDWRDPLLDIPTTLMSKNVVQLFSIPTY